ncbi:MAG: hypothetical protein KKA62_01820 [Nanoarchaeota archaeon]|nr:hypothetical protein [Nanoarchaeota archaeon]MBU1643819.1 hypothetical protein [Nanoarchaeota archaeon]MBU1976671.1 hypothetical protein [Nanoarchaeota archaeon]
MVSDKFFRRGFGLAGLIGFGAIAYTASLGETVYEGNIDGYEVVYQEGTNSGNVMKIKLGRKTYLFNDRKNETKMGGEADKDIGFDELETIAILDDDFFKVYLVTADRNLLQNSLNNSDNSWNYVTRNNDFIVQADVLYNKFRAEIKKRKIAQKKAE